MSLRRWLKLSATRMAKVAASAAGRPAVIVVVLLLIA
jgi:low affinity Fe/Cu permease